MRADMGLGGLERVAGPVFRRGEPGYEQAREDAVWNARKPARYPDLIVIAATQDDAATAVRYARAEGLQVALRRAQLVRRAPARRRPAARPVPAARDHRGPSRRENQCAGRGGRQRRA